MREKFALSISYGNYIINHGGTDKVIREHEILFQEKGISYFFLFPIGNFGTGKKRNLNVWGVNLDGKFVGVYSPSGVKKSLMKVRQDGCKCVGIFIHHLWRVNMDTLSGLLDTIDAPIYYYLHDLRAVCNNNNNNNNALKMDNIFCGFGITNNECKKGCEYYTLANDYRKVFADYFSRYINRFTMIAPSESVKNIYAIAFPLFKNRIRVILHQRECGLIRKEARLQERRLKVAFVGAQNILKGWEHFKTLMEYPGMAEQYDFYYLGNGVEKLKGVNTVDVSVQRDGKDAMVNALKNNQIDIALLLSGWPETYSYTYFESYIAGCFVVTMNVSGNIADMVKKKKNGITIMSTDELIAYFSDEVKVRRDVISFEVENKEFPAKLVQNEEILELVGGEYIDSAEVMLNLVGRQWIYDMMYRFLNQKKLSIQDEI